MKRITRNLLAYWKFWGGMILLFGLMVYSTVMIGERVHDMRYTGGRNSGMAYAVADALSSDAFEKVALYMSDSERMEWENSYEKQEDGRYWLRDVQKTDGTRTRLEQLFGVSQAVVQRLSQMSAKERNRFLEEYGLDKTDYLEIRDVMEADLEKEGTKAIQQDALQFVKDQSREAGVNLERKQTRYLMTSLLFLLLHVLLIAAATAGIGTLLQQLLRLLERRIQEPEFRRGVLLLMDGCCLVSCAVFLYAGAFHILKKSEASVWWYPVGVVLLLLFLAGIWKLYTGSRFENWKEICSFQGKRARRNQRFLGKAMVLGLPAVFLLMGLLAGISRILFAMLLFLTADVALAVSAFLIPEILQLTDGVDEVLEKQDTDW